MFLPAVGWLQRRSASVRIAQVWVLVGFYFFLNLGNTWNTTMPFLTVLCAFTLPLACLAAWCEQNADGHQKEAIVWARGTVAFGGDRT